MVHQLTSAYVDEWFSTPVRLPGNLHRYTELQRRRTERELRLALSRMPASPTDLRSLNPAEKEEMWELTRKITARLLPPASAGDFDRFLTASRPATESFVALAGNFDSSLSDADIFQALRNLWVFNSLQMYLGVPVALTPSAFAYSLLYPCTDNRLDVPSNHRRSVGEFVDWLSLRLEGFEHPPSDASETTVDKLIRMIELEYPRPAFPQVYAGLKSIHDAQRKSIQLRGALQGADERNLVRISVEKGGTSVLADGYLAAGQLSPAAAEVIFAYGVVLQLIDDLQDLDDDLRSGYSSVFTRASMAGPLDGAASQLLNFARKVTLFIQSTPASRSIGVIIGRSCTILILEAIAHAQSRFSRDFLRRVDPISPVRLSFLESLRGRLTPVTSPLPEEALTSAA